MARLTRTISTADLLRDAMILLRDQEPVTIDCRLGNRFRLTLSASRTLAVPTGATGSRFLMLYVEQPTSGGFTLTAGSGISGTISLDTTANAVSIIGLFYDDVKGAWQAIRLGGTMGLGTVTNLTMPAEFSVATATTTPVVTWAAASGYKFIASPNDGSSGAYAGRALVVADMPTGVKTRQFIWFNAAPVATDNFSSVRIPWSCTVTRVGSILGSGTCDFNIEYRTTIGSSGTNILSADQSSSTSLAETTSSFNQSALTGGNYLFVDYSAAASPVEHTIWLEVTCP